MSSQAGLVQLPSRVVPDAEPAVSERSLASYLLLPRPGDAVKWWILPAVFLLGAVGAGHVTNTQLVRAGVVWCVLELLIYQARYQWNDIAGFAADQRHPDRAARGRLPGPAGQARQRKLASAGVAALRLLAAAAVGLVFPELHIELASIGLIGAVFALAAGYEHLKRLGTGWADGVPPRLHPAVVGLWVAVGGGYAIRGLAGLGLVVDLAGHPSLAVCAAVAMWTYGIGFVTARWLTEALPFAHLEQGRLVWRSRAEQRREHLLSLVRWLRDDPGASAPFATPRTWQPLRDRTSLWAPWNAATIASGTSAGWAGLVLAGNPQLRLVFGVGLTFTVATILVLRSPARARVTVLLLAAAAITALELACGVHRCLPSLAPWMVATGAQLWFRSRSLGSTGRARQRSFAGARRA